MKIRKEDLVSDLEKRQIEFENRVKEKHGELYSIDRTEYTNARARINVHCNKHNSDMVVAARSLLKNETACKTCYNEKFSSLQDDFIKKAKEINGDRYDYSKVEYVRTNIPVIITCKIHGDFEQRPANHLRGQQCLQCHNDSLRKKVITKSERNLDLESNFIWKAINKYGEKYDYSLVEYVDLDLPVKIICPVHGEFTQTPHTHLRAENYGCKKCGYNLTRGKKFIEKARAKHGDKYDYSYADLSDLKIKILCNKHMKFFFQEKRNHLMYDGCPDCISHKQSFTTEDFIRIGKEIYGDLYSYENSVYVNNETPIIITCPKHGDFKKIPYDFMRNKGTCQECVQPVDEVRFKNILRRNNIPFTEQLRLPGFLYEYDFKLDNTKLLIEIDDKHHRTDNATKKRDAVKTILAKERGYSIIRIPDTAFDIMLPYFQKELSAYYSYIVDGKLLKDETELRKYLNVDDATSIDIESYKLNLIN